MVRLVVTRPIWLGQDTAQALWSRDLVRQAQGQGVEVLMAPVQQLCAASVDDQQKMVAMLEASDVPGSQDPIWLVSTSPAAAQALSRCPLLAAALMTRRTRLQSAAVGDGSAESLAQVLDDLGLLAAQPPIASPGAQGDADQLASLMAGRAGPRQLLLLLEGRQNRPDLSDALAAHGLQPLRLPLYDRRPLPLPQIPGDGQPVWVLATSSSAVGAIATGLTQQGIDAAAVQWLGHHPAIGRAVAALLPKAPWHLLESLSPSAVLSGITLRP